MKIKLLCVHRFVEGPGVGGVLLAEHLLDDLVARLHRLRHPVLRFAAVLGQCVWHLLQRPLDLNNLYDQIYNLSSALNKTKVMRHQ